MTISELHFLVAEDHDFQRKTLVVALKSLGAKHIIEAADGRLALEHFSDLGTPVDIIVCDLEMPNMDGMEFIRHVGNAGSPVSIILTSAMDRAVISSVETMTKAYGINLLGAIEKPATPAKLPGVVVIHENRGLNPHIEDITRRIALDGYLAFAPDAMTPLGGYPGNEEAAVKAFGTLDPKKRMEDLYTGALYVQQRPESTGKLGAVGFCFGGGICNIFSTRMTDLLASVPFYGAQPAAADVAKIKSPLQIHYAGLDERINAGWPAYEAALKANNKSYEAFIYPNVNHGFNNDTTPRYDKPAADLAWQRTMAFFAKHVKG